jgi:hypothetical protein
MNGKERTHSLFPVRPMIRHARENNPIAAKVAVGESMNLTALESLACLIDMATAMIHSKAKIRFSGKLKKDI